MHILFVLLLPLLVIIISSAFLRFTGGLEEIWGAFRFIYFFCWIKFFFLHLRWNFLFIFIFYLYNVWFGTTHRLTIFASRERCSYNYATHTGTYFLPYFCCFCFYVHVILFIYFSYIILMRCDTVICDTIWCDLFRFG